MTDSRCNLRRVAGVFFRIGFEGEQHELLRGAASPDGRYHHDRQSALYLSPRPEWAWKAVESYIRPEDPARHVRRFAVSEARVVDTRDSQMCRTLGIDPGDSDVPWQPQLARGMQPLTWRVSDNARSVGADGLIYTARSAPSRWHLVLFRWNGSSGPRVEREM